jgi:hypothetical protein
MKRLFPLLVLAVVAGCGQPKYLSPGLYDLFEPYGAPIYERATDSVTIRLAPQGRSQPRDLQVQNIVAPDNSQVDVQGVKWLEKRAQIQVIVNGISTMNHNQTLTFDILQNGVKRQTVTITISALPEIQVKINGQPVNMHEPV